MILSVAPKIAKLLPRLASDHPGEVVAVVAAIRRTLNGAGLDLHDLAREIETPAPAAEIPPPRAQRKSTPRVAPLSAEAMRLLRVGLKLDCFSTWETSFATTIIEAAARRRWRPSRKQSDIAARLVSKASEAEAHP